MILTLDTDVAAGQYNLVPVAPVSTQLPPPENTGTKSPSIADITAGGAVYLNGVFGQNWDGDSWSASSKVAQDGLNRKITTVGKWGMWIADPKADITGDNNTSVAGFTDLLIELMPTAAAQAWSLYLAPKDTETFVPGTVVNVTNYGPAPKPGVMALYVIQLADLGAINGGKVGSIIRKIGLQDSTPGSIGNSWEVGACGFV